MARIIHKQVFTKGFNTALSRESYPADVAFEIMNGHANSTAEGDVFVLKNIKGNTLVSVTLPDGENKVIGTAEDEESHKFYYFLFNSNGFHTIFEYTELTNSIEPILESITDSAQIDILNFSKDYLILMTDVVHNNLLYWVDGLNGARKINIKKCLDKTYSGYGTAITSDYIDAYKKSPINAPIVEYFSDPAIPVNTLYRALRKFAAIHVYDDNERSNSSDISNVALPPKESFTGSTQIPTDNNGINIVVETGSRIVRQIQIVMITTKDTDVVENNDWVTIATLDKAELGIPDDGQYTYKFYNDGSYPAATKTKIERLYSNLPDNPLCQAFVGPAMTYANFKEGFSNVPINVSLATTYEDLFISEGVENKFNSPSIVITEAPNGDYLRHENIPTRTYVNLDGVTHKIGRKDSPRRGNLHTVTIGADVKAGNIFRVYLSNGGIDVFTYQYKAILTDTAATVANKLKELIISSGKIKRKTNGNNPTPDTNIYENLNDGLGNITFKFVILASEDQGYIHSSASVNPVQVNTLKDTGESIRSRKLGASIKYGIVYGQKGKKRSLTYTNDFLIEKAKSENELGGKKTVITELTINHLPPVWADYYEIVRSRDLTYGSFIQMLIQVAIDVPDNGSGEYLDLVVGSLFTYQKIHPNTTLKYEFKPGDRIHFLRKENGDYYDFFETEILSYKTTTDEDIASNVVINGTDIVTVASATVDNIGRFIIIDSVEREIVDAPSGTTYQLNAPIGKSGESRTLLGYKSVDRRGIVRIRKPAAGTITVADKSVVEIYSPSLSGDDLGQKQFFHFNKKYDIIEAGTEQRYHAGDVQNQTAIQPAKIKITEGTIYVRNREMPVTNNVPGAQVVIEDIEDQSFSDFYSSLINDNGKDNIEDNGDGVVKFGSRIRFSNNFVEDTRINGLNDFDNRDRKDYNDKYGDIKRTVFTEGQLLVFKELKDLIVPVFKQIITDASGGEILGISKELLNDARYYSHRGGIGNNPESYCRDESWHYHASVQEGEIVRLGGDGATPISEVYGIDNAMRQALRQAGLNNANIYMQVDPNTGFLVVAIEEYEVKTFNQGFDTKWEPKSAYILPDGATVTITVEPLHGEIDFENGFFTYIGDEGYVGSDSVEYQVTIGDQVITRKLCIEAVPLQNRQRQWVQDPDSATCSGGLRVWTQLMEVYVDNGEPTGNVKPNNPSDPNYVPGVADVACALPVTVNWSHTKDTDPNVESALLLSVNGELQILAFGNDSGTLSGVFVGDIVRARTIHNVGTIPWPADSSANLKVTDDDPTTLFDQTITDALTTELSLSDITVEDKVYDIESTTLSTSILYEPVQLNLSVTSPAPLGSSYKVFDDTTGLFVIFINPQEVNPQNNNGFNYLDDGGTGSIQIFNPHASAQRYDLSNAFVGGGFTSYVIIPAGGNSIVTGLPKTGIAVVQSVPEDVILELLIENSYINEKYSPSNTSDASLVFTFSDNTTFDFLVDADVLRDGTVHTFLIPASDLNKPIKTVNPQLTGVGSDGPKSVGCGVFKNGVSIGTSSGSLISSAGVEIQTPTTISPNQSVIAGDVIKVVHYEIT